METTRRQYTAEFKRDAVALVMEQGYAVTVAATNLGITPKLLSRWKGEQQQHWEGPFPAKGIKRRSTPNCASYARTIGGCGWSATS
jgi:transposase-like protein